METSKTSENIVKGLVEKGSESRVANSFELGEKKCVAESSCIGACNAGFERVRSVMGVGNGVESSSHRDVKGISLFVALTGGVMNKADRERISVVHGGGLLQGNEVAVTNEVDGESISDVNGGRLLQGYEITSLVTNKVDGESVSDVNGGGLLQGNEVKGVVTNKVDGESVTDVNGGLLQGHEGKVNDGEQGFKANLGDFVWVIIKKDLWWPGIVCDASTAPKEVGKAKTSEFGILVRCFGSGNYLWCLPYHMKPFVECFEELLIHSKSRRFLEALDKAVVEFGCRAKDDFTCSCFTKNIVKRTRDIGDSSVTRFEPEAFLGCIKDLARDIYIPSKIDYVAKKNCLSAFYRSLGHLEIPLNELKPVNSGTPSKVKTKQENGYFNDAIENCETGNESRDERKSRLLSYPGERGKTKESTVDVSVGADLNNMNGQPVKKPQKKRGRKKKTVQENVCSSDVLSELRYAGLDCLFPYESKKFESVERFITGYRKWAFSDEIVINHTRQILQGTGMEKTVDTVGKGTTLPKKVKKENKSVTSPTLGTDSKRGSLILDFQNAGSFNLEHQSLANKNTEVTADQALQNNGSGTFYKFVLTPCKLEPKKKKKKKNAENNISMPSWNNISAHPNVYGLNVNGNISTHPNVNVAYVYGPNVNDANVNGNISTHPNVNGNISTHPNVNGNISTHPNVNGAYVYGPNMNGNISTHPNVNGAYVYGPNVSGHITAHTNVNGVNVSSQNVNGAYVYGPNVNGHLERLNQAAMFHRPNLYGSTQQCFTGNYGEPQVGPMSPSLVPAGLSHEPKYGQPPVGPIPPSLVPASLSQEPKYGQPQVGPIPPGHVPASLSHEPKKRGRKRKNIDLQANSGSTIIPNMNESGTEKKNVKRSDKNKEIGVACIDLSYNKVRQDDEEVKGTAFLLKFSPNHLLPSKENLTSVFCKYGPLNESETQVLSENMSGQVVFLDSASAGEAFWGLQNDQPFGPALVNYRIQHLAGSEPVIGFKSPIKSLLPVMDPQAINCSTIIPDLNGNAAENILMNKSTSFDETGQPSSENISLGSKPPQNGEKTRQPSSENISLGLKPPQNVDETRQPSSENISLGLKPPQNGETPDLVGIKKNLQMMNSMLEKAGDTLSSELRAKLESEIKALMNKVSTMDGSSSSCLC